MVRQAGRPYRRTNRGVTLVENLVAGALLATALVGMLTAFFYMLQMTMKTENRVGSFQVARQVMERAHSVTFGPNTDTISKPLASCANCDTWQSPQFAALRYFDQNGNELGCVDATQSACTAKVVPDNTRYRADTTIVSLGLYPPGRPDQNLNRVGVTVYQVNVDKTMGPQMYDIQTLETLQGVQ